MSVDIDRCDVLRLTKRRLPVLLWAWEISSRKTVGKQLRHSLRRHLVNSHPRLYTAFTSIIPSQALQGKPSSIHPRSYYQVRFLARSPSPRQRRPSQTPKHPLTPTFCNATDEMTDESTLNQAKKDDAKKSTSAPSVPRGSKRTPSYARPSSAAGNLPGAPRPSSRAGNKKAATPAAGGTESGSESSKKPTDAKKPDVPRNKSQGGTTQRNGTHRNRQPSSSQANRSSAAKDRSSMGQSSSPAPVSASESSDALSSLQRVIADLKTTAPNQPSPPNNSLATSMHAPQAPGSSLPVNAPIFHPGASAFPTSALPEAARHRKAASLGASALSGNFNSFSPHLGAMIEDVEDGTSAPFEDGEISESFFPNSGHQARSQSQSFMAPRFAALAAQQDHDILGPTGRPQLAPNFMFGARRRTSSNVPMGPLNEEDGAFQFPQQHHQPSEGIVHEQNHRRAENDITGIMAEQVCIVRSPVYLSSPVLDCYTEPNRGPSTAATSALPTAVGI